MSITFELPELEDDLRANYGNLNQAAKEALLIDAYRTGRLSVGRLAGFLERSVSSTMAWLDDRRVGPNYTMDHYAGDVRRLRSPDGNRP